MATKAKKGKQRDKEDLKLFKTRSKGQPQPIVESLVPPIIPQDPLSVIARNPPTLFLARKEIEGLPFIESLYEPRRLYNMEWLKQFGERASLIYWMCCRGEISEVVQSVLETVPCMYNPWHVLPAEWMPYHTGVCPDRCLEEGEPTPPLDMFTDASKREQLVKVMHTFACQIVPKAAYSRRDKGPCPLNPAHEITFLPLKEYRRHIRECLGPAGKPHYCKLNPYHLLNGTEPGQHYEECLDSAPARIKTVLSKSGLTWI